MGVYYQYTNLCSNVLAPHDAPLRHGRYVPSHLEVRSHKNQNGDLIQYLVSYTILSSTNCHTYSQTFRYLISNTSYSTNPNHNTVQNGR